MHASVRRKATLNAWEKLHGTAQTEHHDAPNRAQENEKLPFTPAAAGSLLPPGLTIAPGRPKIVGIIEHALDGALALGQGSHRYTRAGDALPPMTGLLVGVCGPLAMADDVSKAVGMIDAVRRDQVGGIEIVEEGFGW